MYSAIYMRMIRASALETLNEDYVRTARAKGAPEWLVIRSHVLRNAMLPVVTMLGMDIAVSLGATLFVETAYGLPGLGRLFATSLARRDSRHHRLYDDRRDRRQLPDRYPLRGDRPAGPGGSALRGRLGARGTSRARLGVGYSAGVSHVAQARS